MIRKVIGRIGRELNRGISEESVDSKGPKTASGSRVRTPRRVSPPRSEGIGGVYKEKEEEDI